MNEDKGLFTLYMRLAIPILVHIEPLVDLERCGPGAGRPTGWRLQAGDTDRAFVRSLATAGNAYMYSKFSNVCTLFFPSCRFGFGFLSYLILFLSLYLTTTLHHTWVGENEHKAEALPAVAWSGQISAKALTASPAHKRKRFPTIEKIAARRLPSLS